MAYSQASITRAIFMELPKGVIFKTFDCNTYCIKILSNVYGYKEFGCDLFLYLKEKLLNLGYQQSKFEK
jgi:hypothetical protein